MNRVLLCGACVAAVRCLLDQECDQVTVTTASDGTITTKVPITEYKKEEASAAASICRDGLCYQATAVREPEPGIGLCFFCKGDPSAVFRLVQRYPGLVCLLLQNISAQAKTEGVFVKIDVTPI